MVSFTASKIIGIKREKRIEERSVKELVGSTVKEFEDSYRQASNSYTTPHVIILKIIFTEPWSVSVNQTDILKL